MPTAKAIVARSWLAMPIIRHRLLMLPVYSSKPQRKQTRTLVEMFRAQFGLCDS